MGLGLGTSASLAFLHHPGEGPGRVGGTLSSGWRACSLLRKVRARAAYLFGCLRTVDIVAHGTGVGLQSLPLVVKEARHPSLSTAGCSGLTHANEGRISLSFRAKKKRKIPQNRPCWPALTLRRPPDAREQLRGFAASVYVVARRPSRSVVSCRPHPRGPSTPWVRPDSKRRCGERARRRRRLERASTAAAKVVSCTSPRGLEAPRACTEVSTTR